MDGSFDLPKKMKLSFVHWRKLGNLLKVRVVHQLTKYRDKTVHWTIISHSLLYKTLCLESKTKTKQSADTKSWNWFGLP